MRFRTAFALTVVALKTTGGQDVRVSPERATSAGSQLATDQVIALDLNLPAFRVDLRAEGRLRATFPVAVGMRKYKTPIGRFEITSVEWNPWWIPPKSEWARKDTVTPPGPQNPMGRVKIALGSAYFLHGTPVPQSIGRAASHGCVRLTNGDAVELATMVLRAGAPHLDSVAVAGMRLESAPTRFVALDQRIPLLVRYDVVEFRNDSLWVYPDVYRRGAPVVARALVVLDSLGVDTSRVRLSLLRALVKRGARIRSAIPRDSLLRSG